MIDDPLFPTGEAEPPMQAGTTDSPVPPPPEQDPRLGDKTPAYVAWFCKYYPEEALKRYAGSMIQGQRIPPGAKELPKISSESHLPPLGSDLPEGAMAKEPAEEHK